MKKLETDATMGVEEGLRKQLFETRDREERVLLSGLLAQASLLLGNRSEAHFLIEEAEESLRSPWSLHSPRFRTAAENLWRIKTLLHFQEGSVPTVFDLIRHSEEIFGKNPWTSLLRAETHLLAGEVKECQSILFSHLRDPKGGSDGKQIVELPAGAWAVLGESYLREREWEKLDQVLAVCMGLRKLPLEDRVAVARLKVELMLCDGDLVEAWRMVGEMQALHEKMKTHRGLARAFHLSLARVHLYEAQAVEALRRLQLAENESRYPIALWEVEFLRAVVLETDTREAEALLLWKSLSEQAPFTYFGRVAMNRVAEFTDSAPVELRQAETAPSVF